MCGIAGFLAPVSADAGSWHDVATRMARRLQRRGPDDEGLWIDHQAGVALAHRRLAIVDLSPAGHQPMRSASGRYVVVFNGEIYNHLELRQALADAMASAPAGLAAGPSSWCGHSDTETLLAGFEAWGVQETLQRAVGMFAIALWDRAERTLVLARDRLGEKPLYYGLQGRTFLFGSELKALRAHPACVAEVDRAVLAQQLSLGWIPGADAIYRGIHRLPPGTTLTLRWSALGGVADVPSPRPYWRLQEVVGAGLRGRRDWPEGEAVETLDRTLRESVRLQMVADVPLGAFLSGGIDSSTVVALMQAQSRLPVRTFTIGFEEASHNEARDARAVARHLGTDHTELYVTARDALEVIPELAAIYDEPFADASQIPTCLVARMASRHVKVALSGDGGDELFAGYNRHGVAHDLWPRTLHLPAPVRRTAAALLAAVPARWWRSAAGPVGRILPRARIGDLDATARKLSDVLRARDLPHLYELLLRQSSQAEGLVIGADTIPSQLDLDPVMGDASESIMAWDMGLYLPDDILTKVDRAAMWSSLETRVPMLDHRVVALAWSLPLSLKLRDGVGKWLLRQVLGRYVPPALTDRPKQGFGVPVGQWLRGPLRAWAEEMLSETRLRREGYLRPEPVRAKWQEHLSGRRNWQSQLWSMLMFQAWLQREENL